MRKAFLAVVFGSMLILGACQPGDKNTTEEEATDQQDSMRNSVLDKANMELDSTAPSGTDTTSHGDSSSNH